MMKLSDFNQLDNGLSPAIKDFNNPRTTTSILNDATISNIAAHGASLGTPDKLLQFYSDITNELKSGSSSVTLDKMLKQQSEIDYAANLSALRNVLADPNISVEDKTRYTTGFANLTNQKLGSNALSLTVGRQAQMLDSEPTDNDETEFTRLDTSYILDEADAYNGWVNQQINTINNTSDQNGLNKVVDILEMMVPFLEGAAVAETRTAIENGLAGKSGAVIQSLTFLGESKETVRSAIMAMPPDQRKLFARKLINYVKDTGGSITLRPNETMIVKQLQDYLQTGMYGGDDRLVDNIFSVMDFGFLLTPFFKVGKGATSTANIARRAALAEEKLAEAAPVVDEIIGNAVPTAPLDNIINGIRGFDKATSEEIAQARNTIGNGLDDGLSVDEIINNTPAFDKFTADEIAEARAVIGQPLAHSTPPLSDELVQTTRDMISDKITSSLSQLDEAPHKVYQDIRNGINEVVTNVSLLDPKALSKTVITKANDILKQYGFNQIQKEAAKNLKAMVLAESKATRQSVRTTVSPTSLSQTLKNVNPAKARAAFNAVDADKSGRLAEVTYGTNRTDAIANDTLPEISNLDGSVRNKIEMDEAYPKPDEKMVEGLKATRGDIHFTDAEKTAMRNTALADFRDVVGLVPRRAMASVGDGPVSKEIVTDSGVSFDMIYGPKDGGFRSGKEAIDQVKFGLAKYGVDDSEIELLARQANGEWAPVSKVEDGQSFLVRVKYNYEFSPADTQSWTLLSSNKFWRMFDWAPGSGEAGGFFQHFIPSTAVINKTLINSASVASDRSAKIKKDLIQLATDYSQSYKGLDKRQKQLVDAYIIEANNLSLKFNPVNLRARGMNDKAIDTVRSWKRVNDTLYHFENNDLNKTLRARGYWQYIDQSSNTSLIVKPVSNRGFAEGVKAYDSTTGKLSKLSKKDVDELYDSGGSLATTRGKVDTADGKTFEYVIVKNNTDAGYIRRIRDDDPTLNYRDGHYTIRYTDPYFIRKKVVKDGETYWKAVATSGHLKDAEALRDRLRSTDEASEYEIRGDLKRGTLDFEDAEWSSMVSGGRTSQRTRGERLVNGTGQQTDLNHVHIETPEQSLIRSIQSMANRVAHRDFIDSAKARFMNQFRDILPEYKGQAVWPEDVRLIGKGDPSVNRARLKDARTTWRYIESIDSGYVNLLDDTSKNLFKSFSELAGKKGWGWLETAASKASEVGPTGWARKKAFRLLLAANPLRQAPVQAMQALPIVMALNPKMLVTGRLPAQFLFLNYINRGGDTDSFFKALAKFSTGLTTEEAKKLVKDYEYSGFEAAVKANSLIRDDLKSLVDRSVYGKVKAFAAKPLNFTQKIGFEAGENALMRTVWLSEYDLLRSSGVKITPAVLDNLNARVRNLTLNMNKAGELPYNENMLSAALQFFQAPHKAFAQIVMGHTGLSGADRIKLGTSYVLTYGIGGGYILDMVSKNLQTDDKTKNLIEGGIFNVMMNSALSTLYGKEVQVDFSDSLRLLQIPNMFKFVNDLMTMEIAEALSASPSVGLVLGQNPRITNFVEQALRPFTVDDNKKPEEILLAAKSFLNIFSGASNFFKAKYILETGQSVSSSGKVIDFHMNEIEALMKLAGFSSMDEIHQYAFDEKTYKATNEYKNDINKFLTEFSQRLAVEGIANNDARYYLEMMSEAQRVFHNDPFYMKEVIQQLSYKAGRGEYEFYNTIMRLAGFMEEDELRSLIGSAAIKPEQKEQLYQVIEFIKGSN